MREEAAEKKRKEAADKALLGKMSGLLNHGKAKSMKSRLKNAQLEVPWYHARYHAVAGFGLVEKDYEGGGGAPTTLSTTANRALSTETGHCQVLEVVRTEKRKRFSLLTRGSAAAAAEAGGTMMDRVEALEAALEMVRKLEVRC